MIKLSESRESILKVFRPFHYGENTLYFILYKTGEHNSHDSVFYSYFLINNYLWPKMV